MAQLPSAVLSRPSLCSYVCRQCVTGAADPAVPVFPRHFLESSPSAPSCNSYRLFQHPWQSNWPSWPEFSDSHPGYVAQTHGSGAVVGATPQSHVRRRRPEDGDVIVASRRTHWSRWHWRCNWFFQRRDAGSNATAPRSKGNAPVERKLQRLFRREDACKLIKAYLTLVQARRFYWRACRRRRRQPGCCSQKYDGARRVPNCGNL